MACPPTITTKNLTTKFRFNKQLSSDIDEIRMEQDVGWVTRRLLSVAVITIEIKQYMEDGVEHVDLKQCATGGVSPTNERHTLDWEKRSRFDYILCELTGQSRRAKPEDIEDEYLRKGWLEPESQRDGLIESHVVSGQLGWIAHQVWGFEEIEGVRRFSRRLKFEKGEKTLFKKMVYDYPAE